MGDTQQLQFDGLTITGGRPVDFDVHLDESQVIRDGGITRGVVTVCLTLEIQQALSPEERDELARLGEEGVEITRGVAKPGLVTLATIRQCLQAQIARRAAESEAQGERLRAAEATRQDEQRALAARTEAWLAAPTWPYALDGTYAGDLPSGVDIDDARVIALSKARRAERDVRRAERAAKEQAEKERVAAVHAQQLAALLALHPEQQARHAAGYLPEGELVTLAGEYLFAALETTHLSRRDGIVPPLLSEGEECEREDARDVVREAATALTASAFAALRSLQVCPALPPGAVVEARQCYWSAGCAEARCPCSTGPAWTYARVRVEWAGRSLTRCYLL